MSPRELQQRQAEMRARNGKPGLPTVDEIEQARDTLHSAALTMANAGLSRDEITRFFTRVYFVAVLERCGWNQCAAARQAGIHRNSFSRLCGLLRINCRKERRLWVIERRRRARGEA